MPEIPMHKLSDTLAEGTLVAWKKKRGDKVSGGDVLAEIETDKATMEWESPEDGTLTEIYVEEGGKVNVGERIAFIGAEDGASLAVTEEGGQEPARETMEEKKDAPKEKAQTETEKPAPAEEKEANAEPLQERAKEVKPAVAAKEETGGQARVKASPLARRIAAELGVDISAVKCTGPEGRVTETDVRAAGKAKDAPQTAVPQISASPGSRIRLTGMRKVIAERLVASK